ncbi:cytochrome c oxidase subunit 6A1, mitochondrial-like [Ceratina calcarata]|uniref:Cytochrome c oxidase subunit 6A1, mitochondrial-like n=1 Tax=Ceratina calcarata TaxID=156304 RepID=A0AAJ7N864_9HYME|nr:cytochrome c oxidase subunit 6A1, mitochondrial-like [Ceratina calcarata]
MAAPTMNMVKLLKAGQVGRVFTRNYMEQYVKTVEQRSHVTGDGPIKLWRNITFFVAFPTIALAMLNVYLRHQEHPHEEHPPFVAHQYLKIMNKRFPWGDGKHSLFHNPKQNYIPGIGYEE